MPRVDFTELPAAALQAVTLHTGPVRSVRTVQAGHNSAVAAVLATASGPVFVKGIPADHPQAASQHREMAIAPHVPANSPRLLWHTETGGWLLLGYEAVQGRHADYQAPADLHLVLTALEDAQRLQAPAEVELRTAVDRWGPYADEGAAELFAGDVVLHTQWAADDVLIDGRHVRLVDWAWPTRGAGWIDAYMWALRLMEAGHSAVSAVDWACEVTSWRDGDPAAIRAFGAAVARVWHEIAIEEPAAWKVHMAVQAAKLRAYLALEPGKAER
ncbi:aminoglycoside phosphotransferase [Streptomyces dangxiongensis]|uniref:Aminoglycoside phosphotransferase n=1 Tax=Streptomyces dangxiongensis TaxID=1442032 RepID=A0A3G2JF11_9ACTN|nr:aminoglycoside phosphotransferase [Streptomyces dangxiongensis]AYN40956.1 aminoglycoside phosphotransferase [Streptomyces dangxiongensis]